MPNFGETRLHCPLMGLPLIQKWNGSSWVDNPCHDVWKVSVASVNAETITDELLNTGNINPEDSLYNLLNDDLPNCVNSDKSGVVHFPRVPDVLVATVTTEPRHEPDLIQNDPTHRAVRDVVKGLDNGVVLPAARKQLGEALDRANTRQEPLPEGTKHRAPDSRAFSFGV